MTRRPRWRRRLIAALALLGVIAVTVLIVRPAVVSTESGSNASGSGGNEPHSYPTRPASHPGFQLHLTRNPPVHVKFRVPPRGGLLFDLDSGQVLWSRNPTRRLPIASLTKMMTALLVARDSSPHARVKITHEALAYTGSGIGLLPKHEKVQLEALFNGLLLVSGNDAAIALAQHVAGTVPAFVRRMNEQASRMSLGCTRYTSPHGVEDSNRSCAADLAVVARADLAQSRIARIARRKSAHPRMPIKTGRVWLYNNNPLVRLNYPGINGLKTGLTSKAGHCIVATAKRHGVRLGVVLLHSPNLYRQGKRLLDRGFRFSDRRVGSARARRP